MAVELLFGRPGRTGTEGKRPKSLSGPPPRAGAGASRISNLRSCRARGPRSRPEPPRIGRTMIGATLGLDTAGVDASGPPTSPHGALEALDHRSLNQQVVRPHLWPR